MNNKHYRMLLCIKSKPFQNDEKNEVFPHKIPSAAAHKLKSTVNNCNFIVVIKCHRADEITALVTL